MALGSLRARFLLGSVLWTLGLLGFAHLTFVAFQQYLPHMLRIRHWTALSIVALAFLLGGLLQIRRGLSPVRQLRGRLSALRSGSAERVDGRYPSEVQPLVDDLNALLTYREAAVQRALSKAGDLAHGLKTPLALLAQEAESAERSGHHDVAASIRQQVERMQRQVDYHLAHARASASGAVPGTRSVVAESAEGLRRKLARLYEDRGLRLEVCTPVDHAVRVQRVDLDEMLGNLFDNACKWAHSRIVVSSTRTVSSIVIAVDDDGAGLDATMREAVLQRGVRADESAPGSGLGLAIVRDLAEAYGGSVALRASPLGGLSAALTLPST
jgi:signal transduction histidine kinase